MIIARPGANEAHSFRDHREAFSLRVRIVPVVNLQPDESGTGQLPNVPFRQHSPTPLRPRVGKHRNPACPLDAANGIGDLGRGVWNVVRGVGTEEIRERGIPRGNNPGGYEGVGNVGSPHGFRALRPRHDGIPLQGEVIAEKGHHLFRAVDARGSRALQHRYEVGVFRVRPQGE